MKTLLLLRHAKSTWAESAQTDHQRPLDDLGRQAAPLMGRLLCDEQLVPDLVVTSSALRAVSTVKLVTSACGYEGPVREEDGLYLAASTEWLSLLADLPDDADRVLAVGHNPGVEELLVRLTGVRERMPTAALARVELPVASWAELPDGTRGELVRVWRPTEPDSDG